MVLHPHLLRVLLHAIASLTGAGAAGRPPRPGCSFWIADPTLYDLHREPCELAAHSMWTTLTRDAPRGTRALVPLCVARAHWLLLDIDPLARVCTLRDTLPQSASDNALRRHVAATAAHLFPSNRAFNVDACVTATSPPCDHNDCGARTCYTIWARVAGQTSTCATPDTTRTLRRSWLPALAVSNARNTLYPWSAVETRAALGLWLARSARGSLSAKTT